MDIPSLFMIPSAVSSGKVHSVFPNSTDADFDFNRDSSATRVNSQGLIEEVGYFGSELVTNGTFDNNLNNWNLAAGGQTIVWENGKVRLTTDGTFASLQQTITTVVGKVYRARVDIDVTSGSNLALNIGGTQVFGNGKKTLEMLFTATGTATQFQLKRYSGAVSGTFDNATFVEVQGDRARLNYEIEGGLVNTKPSLLLEPQSTNSFPNSEDYTVFTSASAGTGTNPIITSNYSISPDGTKNADRIQFNRGSGTSGTDTSYITKSLSLGTIDATLSIYLKTNDGTTKDVTLRLGAALFDYDVTVTSEWQRFTLSGNTNVDRIQIILYGNQNSQTADLSCFGTQVESLTYATSYIPTNGSTQTRAAETCNGAGTSSTFNSLEGVLYFEGSWIQKSGGTNRRIALSDGTATNRILIQNVNSAENRLQFYVLNSSGTSTDFTFTLSDITDNNKIAFKYKENNFCVFINGIKVLTDTVGTTFSVGTLNTLAFDGGDGGFDFYGKVRDIRVYNTKEMTDSEVDILLTKITS